MPKVNNLKLEVIICDNSKSVDKDSYIKCWKRPIRETHVLECFRIINTKINMVLLLFVPKNILYVTASWLPNNFFFFFFEIGFLITYITHYLSYQRIQIPVPIYELLYIESWYPWQQKLSSWTWSIPKLDICTQIRTIKEHKINKKCKIEINIYQKEMTKGPPRLTIISEWLLHT